jgi:hypothetical protein
MGVNLLYSTLLLLPAVCPAYAAALAEGDKANMVEENDSTPPARVGLSCSTNAATAPPWIFPIHSWLQLNNNPRDSL